MTETAKIKEAEFRGKVLEKLDNIEKVLDNIDERIISNENRIRVLENNWFKLIGMASGAGAMAGIISSIVTRIFNF